MRRILTFFLISLLIFASQRQVYALAIATDNVQIFENGKKVRNNNYIYHSSDKQNIGVCNVGLCRIFQDEYPVFIVKTDNNCNDYTDTCSRDLLWDKAGQQQTRLEFNPKVDDNSIHGYIFLRAEGLLGEERKFYLDMPSGFMINLTSAYKLIKYVLLILIGLAVVYLTRHKLFSKFKTVKKK